MKSEVRKLNPVLAVGIIRKCHHKSEVAVVGLVSNLIVPREMLTRVVSIKEQAVRADSTAIDLFQIDQLMRNLILINLLSKILIKSYGSIRIIKCVKNCFNE